MNLISFKTILLFFLAIFFVLPSLAQQKPNVIFILADDLGYGDLGCYGQTKIETPNIDRLAGSGIRFTQFYAGTSVCAPSRASLMSGLHTGHTPIRGNFEIKPEGQYPLPDSVFTMPEMFRAAGYKTGVFGKWGMGYPGSEGDPVNQGVDEFYGYNCQRQSHNFFPDHLWQNTTRVELRNKPHSNQVDYAPGLIQKKALAFLEKNRSDPFFIYLAYTLPHAALQLPAGDPVFEYYKKKFAEKPKTVSQNWNAGDYQPQAYPHAAYAAMVAKLDAYVGEVVRMLDRLGLAKNTLIVFASDNGPHAEGGNDPAFFNSSAGFRGIKRQLTEGGIRVPVICSWPGKIRAGQISSYTGAFYDFLPTFSGLSGNRTTLKTDGISILPLLLGKGKQKEHDFLYWEFHEDGGRQALRIGKWKGIREGVFKNPLAAIQLYDLDADPAEKNDLAGSHPQLITRMKDTLAREHLESQQFPFFNNSQAKKQ